MRSPRRLLVGLLFVALACTYYFTNPYWFGDAIWYAKDLAKGWNALPSDSGHIIWRPLGYGVWASLSALGIHVDPLVVLRLLSSAGTALLLFATYSLTLRVLSSKRDALLAACLVGVTKICLAYGGSGSSYTTAMAACAYSFVPIMSREQQWRATDAWHSSLALAAGYVTWGMSVLVLPGLFVAQVAFSSGGIRRRLLRATAWSAVYVVVLIVLSIIAYMSHADTNTFFQWVRASSHGDPPQLSILGLARAAYGTLVAFVNLGAAGSIAKSLLLGGHVTTSSIVSSLPLVVGLGFAVALLASFCLITVSRYAGRQSRRFGIVAGTVFLPVAAFALAWKGSDVERFALAVPFLAIVLVFGFAIMRAVVPRTNIPFGAAVTCSLIGLLAVGNLGSFVAPALVTHGGITMRVGREARQHIPPSSLLIVAGNDLFADVVAASSYFYSIQVHNITYDVRVNGLEGYEARIQRLARSAIEQQGKVAVLSDFLGQGTPGGIGLIEREHPKPSVDEIGRLFADWPQSNRWTIDRFTFVEVVPPSGNLQDAGNR